MLLCQIHGLVHFGLGNFIRVDAAHAYPFLMNMEHDLGGFFMGFIEELLQHVNDELHRGVIVIQHQNLIHRRLFGFAATFNGNAVVQVVTVIRNLYIVVVPSHTLYQLLSSHQLRLAGRLLANPATLLPNTIWDRDRQAKGHKD